MPFVQGLLEDEAYEVLPYRCGIPSTTPFSQAGILYGDNSEIPAFRWWDKQSGMLVAFGAQSTFKHVAHKYFQHCQSLVDGGACIAACYSAGAKPEFSLGYRKRDIYLPRKPADLPRLFANWTLDTVKLAEWLVHGLWEIFKGDRNYVWALLRGQRAARLYVVSDILEEIFLHQLTRGAVIHAMDGDCPSIYGAFYAYDETAHAYGPGSDYSFRILRHIDRTIQQVALNRSPSSRRSWLRSRDDRRGAKGKREYELVLLSDHGQIDTVPFDNRYGHRFGEIIAQWLPTYDIEEHLGKHFPPREAIDGHIVLTYSGGLAHMYFKDLSWRLSKTEIEQRFPGLIARIARLPGIECVLVRDSTQNVIVSERGELKFDAGMPLSGEAREFLARFDDPDLVARQLDRLNLFERAGDLILFGRFEDGKQINFEHQVGGHGSLGGEQLHPFIMARRKWGLKTEFTNGAYDLHPLLMRMRKQLDT